MATVRWLIWALPFPNRAGCHASVLDRSTPCQGTILSRECAATIHLSPPPCLLMPTPSTAQQASVTPLRSQFRPSSQTPLVRASNPQRLTFAQRVWTCQQQTPCCRISFICISMQMHTFCAAHNLPLQTFFSLPCMSV